MGKLGGRTPSRREINHRSKMLVEILANLGDGAASNVADVGDSLEVTTGRQAIVLPRMRKSKVKSTVVFGAEHFDLRSDVGVGKIFTDFGVPKVLLAKVPYCTNVGGVFQVHPNNASSGADKWVTLHYVNPKDEDDCTSPLDEVGLVDHAQDGAVDGPN